MVQILQVLPEAEYRVFCYFSDGRIKLYDARPLIEGGGVFSRIVDPAVFRDTCTGLDGTLAWDVNGDRDPYACIDLDPDTVYAKAVDARDPLSRTA